MKRIENISERYKRDCGFLIAGAVIVFVMVYLASVVTYHPITYEQAAINDVLSRIDSGCNDLFIVRCLDTDGYCNFIKRCVNGDYCKNVYVPIEECLAR